MAIKQVTLKNKAGDVYHPETTAAQVKRGESTVDAALTAVEALAGAAVPNSAKGAASGVATLDASGKVPRAQLPDAALTAASKSVADIAALTALTIAEAPVNTIVFVANATGDSTVESGWGLYLRQSTGSTLADWEKIGEKDSMDLTMVDQEARDAASTAQGEVDALENTVEGLGTVYVKAAGADLSGLKDNDLILEIQ